MDMDNIIKELTLKFPNDQELGREVRDGELNSRFDSWHETHFEVVSAITYLLNQKFYTGLAKKVSNTNGTGGLYELAYDLTNEFEELHKDRKWDGDYFDAMDDFLNNKLK